MSVLSQKKAESPEAPTYIPLRSEEGVAGLEEDDPVKDIIKRNERR